jgi:hypothetical protein
MKKIGAEVITMAGMILLTGVSYVLANESKSEGALDYSGVTGIYYTLIGLILAYGAYDSFFRKS